MMARVGWAAANRASHATKSPSGLAGHHTTPTDAAARDRSNSVRSVVALISGKLDTSESVEAVAVNRGINEVPQCKFVGPGGAGDPRLLERNN